MHRSGQGWWEGSPGRTPPPWAGVSKDGRRISIAYSLPIVTCRAARLHTAAPQCQVCSWDSPVPVAGLQQERGAVGTAVGKQMATEVRVQATRPDLSSLPGTAARGLSPGQL